VTSKIASAGPTLHEFSAIVEGVPVIVKKLEDDPICLRASAGGDAEEGFYLTYRGDKEKIGRLLRAVKLAFEIARPPDPG
jgi:hypothetical protein